MDSKTFILNDRHKLTERASRLQQDDKGLFSALFHFLISSVCLLFTSRHTDWIYFQGVLGKHIINHFKNKGKISRLQLLFQDPSIPSEWVKWFLLADKHSVLMSIRTLKRKSWVCSDRKTQIQKRRCTQRKKKEDVVYHNTVNTFVSLTHPNKAFHRDYSKHVTFQL